VVPSPTPSPTAPEPPPPPVAAGAEVTYDFEISLYHGEQELGAPELTFSEVFDRGKPVVLSLYAGLCPICRRELPLLQEAYVRYGQDVLFVGVDIGPFTGLGQERDARALLAELHIGFPAGGTPDGAIMHEYQVLGMPELLLFSADGDLVDRFSGHVNVQRLERNIEALLS
jgi:cytochrome c biogenesis protein CcmG/thiol:disulfide interchange protein DsbE